MRRNYSTVRERMAQAIAHELSQKDGHWPTVKDKVRDLLGTDIRCVGELYQLADAAAAAVLDCGRVRVIAARNHAPPS